MRNLRNESGQVMVLTALFMVVMVGMTAFVVDVGSWFHAQRATQSTVDAAALAGAQALPADPSTATSLAIDYGAKNGGGIAGANITFESKYTANDTIRVTATKPAPGFFSSIFGITSVTVGAHASAVTGVPTQALYVAPIAVNIAHPDLSGPNCPKGCLGPAYQTTLPLDKTGAPGAFDLLNLNQGQTNGTVGASTLADWIQNGYSKYLPLGGYFSDPGAKFNGNRSRTLSTPGSDRPPLPVYDTLVGQGSNAQLPRDRVGFFHLLAGSQIQGNSGTLIGYFTEVDLAGHLPASGPDNVPDPGVYSVALVD